MSSIVYFSRLVFQGYEENNEEFGESNYKNFLHRKLYRKTKESNV